MENCIGHALIPRKTSYATYKADPTREKIALCVAGYQLAEDWLKCMAKFDTGCDEDWMSEKLASKIGLKLTETDSIMCTNFDGSRFISDQITDKITWIHDNNKKSICGTFRISENQPYDVVIGYRTLFHENILRTGVKIHNAGILTTKKISKGLCFIYFQTSPYKGFANTTMM